ncbi:MAG TPA: hypothetical protein VF765_21720 [Polyangiaceae bacterium]
MKTAILASPLFLILAACAAGGHTPEQTQTGTGWEGDAGGDDAGEAGVATGDDGGSGPVTTHVDGGGDACTATDAPDDQGVDANCDGADGIVGKDVYVDPNTGEDTNEGTPMAPLRTLSAALKLATSRAGSVLVDAGTLQDSDLSATGTWAIYGGYPTTFIGPPQRGLTIVSPGSSGVLVEQASSARLAHITVQTQAPATTDPPSVYGVRSSAQNLALDDVDIEAPPAGSGTSGAAGSAGAAGATGNVGQKCSGAIVPQWAIGATDGNGNATSPDGATRAGVWPKTPARQATAGLAGTDGVDASGKLALSNGLVSGDQGTAGTGNGTPGYGGAGSSGNGTMVTSYEYQQTWISGGFGGNGGCPGSGGEPGTSGGSSIAVLVISGHVDVTRSNLQSSLGGTGGDGGAGGAGGTGGLGGPPAYESGASPFNPAPSCPDPSKDEMQLECTAYGGQGGNGGGGGHGGGGAGGWSIGVLMASGATASVDSTTTITASKGGAGGAGSQGLRAPSGQSHGQYTLVP